MIRIILALIISPTFAYSQMSQQQQAEINYRNYAINPGGESGVVGVITAASGTVTASSAEHSGSGAISINSDGNSQTWDLPTIALKPETYGKACRATFTFVYNGGIAALGDYTAKVRNITDSADLTLPLDLSVTDAVRPTEYTVGFTCPSDAAKQVAVRLTSTVANAEAIIIDNIYIGRDNKLSTVNDTAELIAHAAYHDTCNWSKSGSSFSAFGTGACDPIDVYVSSVPVNTADNDLPDIVFDNLPAGRYVVNMTTQMSTSSATLQRAGVAIYDGSVVRGEIQQLLVETAAPDITRNAVTVVAAFEYDTAGPRTFSVYGAIDGGNLTIQGAEAKAGVRFTVTRYPLQSPRNQVTLETQGQFWGAEINGANPSIKLGGTFDEVTSSALTLSAHPDSNPVRIACTSGTASTGTTCSVDETVGVSIDVHTSGLYRVLFQTNTSIQADTGLSAAAELKIARTSDTSDAILEENMDQIEIFYEGTGANSTFRNQFSAESVFFLNAGTHAFRVFAKSGGTSTDGYSIQCTNYACNWIIVPYTQNFPQAVAISNVATGGDATGCPNGENICSGTSSPTPTCFSQTNLDSCTITSFHWSISGDMFTAILGANIDLTTGAADADFEIDLPIPPDANFSDDGQCWGSGTRSTIAGLAYQAGAQNWYIKSQGGNTRVEFLGSSSSSGVQTYVMGFSCYLDQ